MDKNSMQSVPAGKLLSTQTTSFRDHELAEEMSVHSFYREGVDAAADTWIDFRGVLRQLWLRKGLIASVVLGITLLALIITLSLTPRFIASAKVAVDPRNSPVVEITSNLRGQSIDESFIESQIHTITSPQLGVRVINQLKLQDNPEFNPSLKTANPLAGLLSGLFKPEPTNPAEFRAEIIEKFFKKVSVDREGKSRIFSISFESRDRNTAMQVANALAKQYLAVKSETQSSATKKSARWLDKHLTTLRESVRISEQAVEKYRQKAGLLKSQGDATVISQQLNELNTELMTARARRTEAEAALQQIESQGNSSMWASNPQVMSSPVINNLRIEENDIMQKIAEQTSGIAVGYSGMKKLKAQLKVVRGSIAAEIDRIRQAIRDQVQTAKARENALANGVERLESSFATRNQGQARLRTLENEAQANQKLLETFLQGFKQTSAMQGYQEVGARIVSFAEYPLRPSFPNKTLIVGLAAIGALGIAIVLALLLEYLDRSFRSGAQIEAQTGLRNLANVPLIKTDIQTKSVLTQHPIQHPYSEYGESLRTLYINLLNTTATKKVPKLILVTSTFPGEGKTVLAISFARMLALQGLAVTLIDGDIRCGKIGSTSKSKWGFANVLAGNMSLKDSIVRDKRTSLKVITAGTSEIQPQELFAKEALTSALATLSAENDCVIIDSPPILAVADTLLLSRVVDQTLYVVRWGTSPRDQVTAGIKQLRDAGANIAGVVLNAVNMSEYAEYAYGASGAYNRGFAKYYNESTQEL